MLYNSLQFLFVFLPLSVLLYFLAAKLSGGLANAVLAVMSFIFYGWSDPKNLIIIGISILVNYSLGAWLRSREEKRLNGKWILTVGVIANLASLGYYKYANFLFANYAAVRGHPFLPLNIVLPIGISFFTFTQIAFLVDAHRGNAKELDFFRYCLFVAFFPHLIAGPIVHHAELMPQFGEGEDESVAEDAVSPSPFDPESGTETLAGTDDLHTAKPRAVRLHYRSSPVTTRRITAKPKRWNENNFAIGLAFLTCGLFYKVAVADSCAPWADSVFGKPGAVNALDVSTLDAWYGAIAYTMQIYFDFAGYSDMAIGLAMMFNVRLPDNFNNPYQSVNIIDFWRRWHMTLSRFLRDYLYIPLGGNRKGEIRRQVNLLATMLLGGIWHGAGWTYAIWGGYHGILLVINHGWSKAARPFPTAVARILTFLAVVFGWVAFRAKNLDSLGQRLREMFGRGKVPPIPILPVDTPYVPYCVLVLLVLWVNFAPNTKQWVEARPLSRKRAVLLGVMFFLCIVRIIGSNLSKQTQPFIYFQF